MSCAIRVRMYRPLIENVMYVFSRPCTRAIASGRSRRSIAFSTVMHAASSCGTACSRPSSRSSSTSSPSSSTGFSSARAPFFPRSSGRIESGTTKMRRPTVKRTMSVMRKAVSTGSTISELR